MVYAGPTGAAAKHIPSNAIKPAYTAAMATSDLKLAAIFGDRAPWPRQRF